MALKKALTTVWGFEASDAYHRVENVSLKGKAEINFNLRAYKDVGNFAAFFDVSMSCPYDIYGDNPIAQAYIYLKTLPEFADAEDC